MFWAYKTTVKTLTGKTLVVQTYVSEVVVPIKKGVPSYITFNILIKRKMRRPYENTSTYREKE